MTAPPDVWNIASVADAARARAAVDRIATDAGAPALERTRFLTALTARLRRCLGKVATRPRFTRTLVGNKPISLIRCNASL